MMSNIKVAFVPILVGLIALTGVCVGEEMCQLSSAYVQGETNKLTWSVSLDRLKKQSSWDPIRQEIPLLPHAAVGVALTWLLQQGVMTNDLMVTDIKMPGRRSPQESQWYYQIDFAPRTVPVATRSMQYWMDRRQVIVLLDGSIVEPQSVWTNAVVNASGGTPLVAAASAVPVRPACVTTNKPPTPSVGNNDLQEIRKLVSDGKYEEALQRHLWFHEESKKSAGMAGVRLSFALSQWFELGQIYPKALEALKDIRNQNEKLLLEGKGGFSEFHDYYAINRTLNENDKTYNLFKQIHRQYPDIAARCFHVVLDLIVKHKDYELCGTYIKDPIGSYEQIRHMRELNLTIAKTNPEMHEAHFKAYTDETFIHGTVQLIDIMVHLQRLADAKEIQKRAFDYFPDQKIKDAIPAN